jgi:DNA polymerase I-like protein with 3'-5' exonuclease and polymerase domains
MIHPDQLITLDFETYFSKDYTLRKLSTSEYVRDERFKTQCVGIKIGTGNVLWIPDKHVEDAIRSIDWTSHALLAHHTQFDGFVLSDRYGCTPAYYCDTLSMGRGLHSVGMGASLNELAAFYGLGNKVPDVLSQTKGILDLPPELMHELGTYCAVDVQLCYDLFWRMVEQFPQNEMDLIDETCRMFCEPILYLDEQRATQALYDERAEKARRIQQARRDPTDLSSNIKFAEVLRQLGVDPPMKKSPTTGKNTYAFAKNDFGFQELMEHDDETVRTVVAARLAVKSTIKETRALRLLQEGAGGRSIPVYLRYYGAHTGRWSGGNKMNLQNLPRGGELRKSLLAPDGYVLVVSDSAQIEARTLAWLADDQEVLNQFAAGEDVYKIMAAKIYNKDIADITKAERFVGKVAILGLGYGMGWRKFLMTITLGLMGPKMQIEPEEAQAVVNTYRRERRAIPKFWEVCTDMLLHMLNDMDMEYSVLRVDGAANRIYLPNGMYLEYPGLCQSQDGFVYFDYENAAIIDRGGRPNPRRARRIYGGLLAENITQAIARIIVGEQLLTIAGSYRVATTTHDEIVSVAPETDADEALEFSLTTMRTPPAWASNLPLNAEGGWAREYSK